ncbi:hypothetical protein G6F60_014916 [Rhizopus arrhizus]|nr:hypothetical protein G6F60_014916 [Rhizopus arrhizus]
MEQGGIVALGENHLPCSLHCPGIALAAGGGELHQRLCGLAIAGQALDALHRLRRKLQPGGMGIRTVRGLGYMLEDGQDDSAP